VDLSISCDTAQYKAWSSAAVAMIFFYVIGIPTIIFSQLFYHRKQLNDPVVKSRLRFLYEGYTIYFWELVVVARKVLLVAIVVFLKDDSFRSVFAGIWLLCIALFANVWSRPYHSASLQLLESSSLTVILASLLFGLLSFAPDFNERDSEQDLVIFFVLFLNCLMTVILLLALSYHYYKHLSQNKIFQKVVSKLQLWINASRNAGRENNDELEMEMESFTEEKYNIRHSKQVTVEQLRKARADFKLSLSESPISGYDTNDTVGVGVQREWTLSASNGSQPNALRREWSSASSHQNDENPDEPAT